MPASEAADISVGLSDVSSDAEELGPRSSKAPHLCASVDDCGMLHDHVLSLDEDGSSEDGLVKMMS